MHLSSQRPSVNFVVPEGHSETHVLDIGTKRLFSDVDLQEVH